MAEMTIQLRCDPATGKKDIIVSLRSDEDALPQEHEQLHKKLVEKLIDGGIVAATELGKIIVEREEEPDTIEQQRAEQPQAHSQAETSD
ncbi:MAG: hypothetical protein KatS3mg105_4215 [Gemmatales bacterium]|nr:MAG: hypothetical protein KatS3mg105_4215 [Gemmatales bacterium]